MNVPQKTLDLSGMSKKVGSMKGRLVGKERGEGERGRKAGQADKDPKARENMEFLRNSRKISVAGVHRVSGRAVGSGSGGLGIASQRVSPMNQTAGLRTGEERYSPKEIQGPLGRRRR